MSERSDWSLQRIKTVIGNALDAFYEADGVLLDTGPRGVGERAVMFHLTRRLVGQFDPLDVDVEYDKQGEGRRADPKSSHGVGVIPDLIVHRRGQRSHNLLAVEAKLKAKHGPAERVADVVKLCHLVTEHEYAYGLFILLGRDRATCKLSWLERQDDVLFHELDPALEHYRHGELFRAPLDASKLIARPPS